MFNAIDVATLQLCTVIASAAYALVFFCLWLNRRAGRHMLHWAAAWALYALTIAGFATVPLVGQSWLTQPLYVGLSLSSALLVSGIRAFDGDAPFPPWMAGVVLVPLFMHDGPRVLAAAGVPPGWVATRIADTVGLAVATAILGWAVLMRAKDERHLVGRRIAGFALLAYVPGYCVAIAGLVLSPQTDFLTRIPMLLDPMLVAIISLGLLAMVGERAQQALRDAALRDPLTGAWNRGGLLAAEPRLARAGTGIIAIDIDHFKEINDQHGHVAGDAVLCVLAAEAMRLAAARGGHVARIGGDEFVAILPDGRFAGAVEFSEALRAAIHTSDALPVWTISLGASVIAPGETMLGAAIARADATLYRAKTAGRDRLVA
ncbi:GGDEF domain-containing protein [Sphingomonas sp.]|uniref:GGDEF domain-containing protein n=1 Tax=Sphingomonas sp. TaxID=28214 RepID=UPI003B3B95D0